MPSTGASCRWNWPNERYLPRSDDGGREANMEDPFDPGHTYKYAAPGPLLLNGDPAGDYALWVPTNFPNLKQRLRQVLLQASRKPGALGRVESRAQAEERQAAKAATRR